MEGYQHPYELLHLNVVKVKDLYDVVERRVEKHPYILVSEANTEKRGQKSGQRVKGAEGGVHGGGKIPEMMAVGDNLAKDEEKPPKISCGSNKYVVRSKGNSKEGRVGNGHQYKRGRVLRG